MSILSCDYDGDYDYYIDWRVTEQAPFIKLSGDKDLGREYKYNDSINSTQHILNEVMELDPHVMDKCCECGCEIKENQVFWVCRVETNEYEEDPMWEAFDALSGSEYDAEGCSVASSKREWFFQHHACWKFARKLNKLGACQPFGGVAEAVEKVNTDNPIENELWDQWERIQNKYSDEQDKE